MGYLALYRKYRPSSFSDLVGQNEVASIIKNEILNDKISHAYLFSGPRGTGKTSAAKIIARMINCSDLGADGVPCGKCVSCSNFDASSDIVEIDAASNNGVDEIRELRDKVNLVPTFGRYKVYIIDEVHMLTTQAFNALLKTLEEPPSHIVFILATTEFYKIPATVVSRCQKFQFLKFSDEDIAGRLKYIANCESINVCDDVLYEIARLSDGGLRDAINMLDQLSSFKANSLTVEDVYELNGVISYCDFSALLHNFRDKNYKFLINFIDDIDKKGKNIERFIADFITFVKDIIVFQNTGIIYGGSEKKVVLNDVSKLFSNNQLCDIIVELNDLSVRLKNSSFVKILLITEFINISNLYCDSVTNDSSSNDNQNDSKNVIDSFQNVNHNNFSNINNLTNNNNLKVTKISDMERKRRINNAFATASKSAKEKFLNEWTVAIDKVSNDKKYSLIAGIINDVEIMVVGAQNVIFLAQYGSLLERLFDHIDIIELLLFDVFHIKYKVVFLLKDEWEYEKNKYILALKSGEKYVYIEDNNSNEVNEDIVSSLDDDVEKIISIFGDSIISYE